MRECKVGTAAEYDRWFKLWAETDDPEAIERLSAIDPNADLKAALARTR
jgi:hypothetical protein